MRFVDTSYWVALRDRSDRNHSMARALWEERRQRLVTSNHVLGETWTFLRRRAGHHAAREFLDAAGASARLSRHHVDEAMEAEAWEWLRRHDERTYSFVDASSFAVMRRLRLSEVLSFDGDFSAAGFVEVRT